MTTLTTRRALLVGAAAVPALALPAVVAPAIPALATAVPIAAPDPVIALADRAIEAWEAHGDACNAFAPFEHMMFEWRRNNPPPAKVKVEPDPVAAAGLSKDEQNFLAILRSPLKYKAAAEQDKSALRRWKRRKKAAERRTGYTKADANTGAACDASWEAMRALRDAVPQTIVGLAAKAKAARHLKDDIAHELEASLVRDICVMAGEVNVPDIEAD